MKKFEILDCTLRDGGYYNNWNFNLDLIQNYLNSLNSTKIRFIELGFRFNDDVKTKGLTAYTEDNLINKLKIPKDIKLGIMINASDLLDSTKSKFNLNVLKKILPLNSAKRINFLRVACHHEEVFKLNNFFQYMKKFKIKIFINVMQISEINRNKLIKICNFLKNKNTSVIYLADSLGALTEKKLNFILNIMKQRWKKQIGIHAHDNLNLALKNSLFAVKNNVGWIDSTLTGMGRGPGNLKTEEILKFSNAHKKTKKLNQLVKKFKNLKKVYNWGTNSYYRMAAKNKIHPTYIQKILNDKRYKKKDYIKIIRDLKNSGASQYNPYKLINSAYFISNNPQGTLNPTSLLKGKNILILGAGKKLSNSSKKIEKIIKKKKLYVIALNLLNPLKEEHINRRVSCHPFRIMSDKIKYLKLSKKIILPYSMLTKRLRNTLRFKKNYFYDYGLMINTKKNYLIRNNYCSLPYTLAIGYALSLGIAGKAKTIKVAGFDGYDKSDVDQDETEEIFYYFKKKYSKYQISSLTKTKLKSLRFKKI